MTSFLEISPTLLTNILTLAEASLSGNTMWHLCRWHGKALEDFCGYSSVIKRGSNEQYHTHVLVGSRAEGLHGLTSDADLLYVQRYGLVGTHEEDGVDILAETTDTYPGYTKLRCLVDSVVDVNKGDFLDTRFVVLDDFERNGPAFCELASKYPTKDVAFMDVPGLYFVPSYDQVLCIPCQEWPDQAASWLGRHRPSGWPPKDICTRIVDSGCGVVPVAHKQSRQPDLEWRFSFTEAETILIKSLDASIKYCYVQFKDIIKKMLAPHTFLGSYCLKTILLWTCERIHLKTWKEHIDRGTGFILLLDELIHYLTQKCIPNYFIPENNIIVHVDRIHVNTLLQKLVLIRRNPIGAILNNMHWSLDMPAYELDPELKEEVIRCWDPVRNVHLDSENITTDLINKCLQNIAFLKLTTNDYEGVVKALEVLSVSFLENMLQRVTNVQWIPEDEMSEETKEAFTGTCESEWKADHIARIATVYSIYVMQQSLAGQEISEEYCSRAKTLFEESLILCPTLQSATIKYGLFLRSLGENARAIGVLQSAITSQEDEADFDHDEDREEEDDYLPYLCCLDRVGALCDQSLHDELQSLLLVEVNERDLASYLLLRCHASAGQIHEARGLLPAYKSYLDNSPADERAKYQLLGQCYMVTGMYEEALAVFQSAQDRLRETLGCGDTPELTYNSSLIQLCNTMANEGDGEPPSKKRASGEISASSL